MVWGFFQNQFTPLDFDAFESSFLASWGLGVSAIRFEISSDKLEPKKKKFRNSRVISNLHNPAINSINPINEL